MNRDYFKHLNRKKQYTKYVATEKRYKRTPLSRYGWELQKQTAAYEAAAAAGFRNPNCSDVKSIIGVNNVIAYLTKYVTKTPLAKTYTIGEGEKQKRNTIVCHDCRPVSGRIWGCSDAIRDLAYKRETVSVTTYNFGTVSSVGNDPVINYLNKLSTDKDVRSETIEEHDVVIFRSKLKQKTLMQRHSPELYERFLDYHNRIYKRLYGRKRKEKPKNPINAFISVLKIHKKEPTPPQNWPPPPLSDWQIPF